MKRVIGIVAGVIIVAVALALLGGTKFFQIRKLIAAGKNQAMPPETISSAIVKEEKWQGTLTAVGTITAAQGANVTTELAGTVKEIAFESGATVTNGALLVRLDTSSEDAQLRAIEAQVDLARINAERTRALIASKAISQSDLDTAEATLKQNEANAENIRATIAKKTIRAPFAGKLGLRLVNLGEYLDVGKPIVSLQSLTPVYADFSLPQQELAQLSDGMKVRLSSDTYTNRVFDGLVTAINPDLDTATRSVRLRATFDNADGLLRPGMFARIELLLPTEQTVTVVPATSVLSAPFGDSVYIIEQKPATNNAAAELVVRQQFIRTGRARGDFVSIETGVKPGEKIVSSGVFKLRNGMGVVENNELAPKPSATPKPTDS
jgi:membrane fusion protein, multidrug efflux system